jgi:hypothetical protein
MMMTKNICFAAIAASMLSGVVAADVLSSLTVNSGSSASVQIRLEVSTFVGGANDTDSANAGVGGVGEIALGPDQAPFSTIDVNSLGLGIGNVNLDYEFYCIPIFGCSVTADLGVTNFNLGIAETLSASISGGSATFNNAIFAPSFDFNVNIGGIISTSFSGNFVETAEQTFSCDVDAENGTASISNFQISQIVFVVPPEELPDGVDSVTIFADVNLSNVTMSGTYDETKDVPGDLNGDQKVDGGDLGILLSQFNQPGTADFDDSGFVDGGDLGFLLSVWTI